MAPCLLLSFSFSSLLLLLVFLIPIFRAPPLIRPPNVLLRSANPVLQLLPPLLHDAQPPHRTPLPLFRLLRTIVMVVVIVLVIPSLLLRR